MIRQAVFLGWGSSPAHWFADSWDFSKRRKFRNCGSGELHLCSPLKILSSVLKIKGRLDVLQECNLEGTVAGLFRCTELIRYWRSWQKCLTKALSIISQQSWLTLEVLVVWMLTNMISIYKDREEDPGNYRPVKEGHGADHFEYHHTACTAQTAMQTQAAKADSAWLTLQPPLSPSPPPPPPVTGRQLMRKQTKTRVFSCTKGMVITEDRFIVDWLPF